jgi:hypothetical protein
MVVFKVGAELTCPFIDSVLSYKIPHFLLQRPCQVVRSPEFRISPGPLSASLTSDQPLPLVTEKTSEHACWTVTNRRKGCNVALHARRAATTAA